MTNLLLRRFVKNHEDTQNTAVRGRYGAFCGIIGIAANTALFLAKLLAGLALRSVSVMADSFNNLSDAGSSVITLIGFHLSGKPADAEHPFGHGRAEYIVSLIIGFLVLLLGYEFLRTSIDKIRTPEAVLLNGVSLAVLLIAVLAKLWLFFFYRTCGRRIHSSALLAVSIDSRNDVLVTLATIVSIVVSHLAHISIDGYIGVFVACVLLYSGWTIARGAASPLLGEPAARETVTQIRKAVLSFDEILGVHDLIVHNYGTGHIIASIHAELADTLPLPQAHAVIDRAEREISKKLGVLLVIHIDPVDLNNPELSALRKAVISILSKRTDAAAHDFRLIRGKRKTRLFLFDLEMRHGSDPERLAALADELKAACELTNPAITCVIKTEHSYVTIGEAGD